MNAPTSDPTTTGALLSPERAARLIGVEPGTLKAWRRRRVGPAYVRVARPVVMYRQEDLDAWIREQRVDPAVPA